MKYQSTKRVDYDRESYYVKAPIAVKFLQWIKFKDRKLRGGRILLAYITHCLFLFLLIWWVWALETQSLKVKSELEHSLKESIASILGKETMSHTAIKHGMYFNSNVKLAK